MRGKLYANNITKKDLNLNKCCINESVSEWMEQDIIVPDTKPDALKIVYVNVNTICI